jgi:iron complex transport system ATP-binding protein
VVLFDTEGSITVGSAEEQLSRERLETAFRAPFDTLYERQNLYRELLTRTAEGHGGDEA